MLGKRLWEKNLKYTFTMTQIIVPPQHPFGGWFHVNTLRIYHVYL